MLTIKMATKKDMSAILRVEDSWSEQARASAEKFISRLDLFGEGFFLAARDDHIVASITAMPLQYTKETIHQFSNWDDVTNRGYLYPNDLAACNALYIVSGVIDVNYRGHDIFAPMVLREVALARELGLRYVVAGAVLPGYAKYCQKHGECTAYDYVSLRRGKHLIDPLLSLYEAIDFFVPDQDHVVAEYFPDDASRNYAGLVVRDLHTHPL